MILLGEKFAEEGLFGCLGISICFVCFGCPGKKPLE